MKQWQYHWKYSYKGKYTYGLLPVVSQDALLFAFSITDFLASHDPLGPIFENSIGRLSSLRMWLGYSCFSSQLSLSFNSSLVHSSSSHFSSNLARHILFCPTLLSKYKNILSFLCDLSKNSPSFVPGTCFWLFVY